MTLLIYLQWSPDGKILLFGMVNGEVHNYDNLGNFIVSVFTVKYLKIWTPEKIAVITLKFEQSSFIVE